MPKRRFKKIALTGCSVGLVFLAVYCVFFRAAVTITSYDALGIWAVGLSMPTGNAEISQTEETSEEISKNTEKSSQEPSSQTESRQSSEQSSSQSGSEPEYTTPSKEELDAYDSAHEGEAQYPVNEVTLINCDEQYQNVRIKNASSTSFDIKKELEAELGFEIKDTKEPQVLIYHTHTCESYLTYDTGYYYESFYPRTENNEENVCAVGDVIADTLNNAGIVTLHDTTQHDNPSYNGAYDRSLDTINSYLEKYPSIKVVLDIHRDGLGEGGESGKTKTVFEVNGKKAAQVMILAGYNYDPSLDFDDWEYNLRFALRLQQAAENMYPNMTRPLYFADFMYNMNVNTGSLLIEIGTDSNTLSEAKYTGYLLGNVLAQVLSEV